jgi:DNA-binding protein HU-beta
MNKTELIEDVANKAGLTKAQTQDVLTALVSTITETVANGDKVILVGFGSFEPKVRSAREGAIPKLARLFKFPPPGCRLFRREKPFGRR